MPIDTHHALIERINQSNPQVFPSPHTLRHPPDGFRPNVISIEDAFFGDSGKGSITAKFNQQLNKDKRLVTMRFNGGANAGHETLADGKLVVTHQVPSGIISAGATCIITRGMVVHPADLVTEIDDLTILFGGALPGKLHMDERVPLTLDTHRALEGALKSVTSGGAGSTGRGIATGYASFYERVAVTLKDLLAEDWEDTLTAHYALYRSLVCGFPGDRDLSEYTVNTYKNGKTELQEVGNLKTFLTRLAEARARLRPYASSDIYAILRDAWEDPSIPITLEGAQGAGIDPYHGVYPDVTASRPMSRNINDATYNIVEPSRIYYRTAVCKATYMSSVGIRVLPTVRDAGAETWIQEAFDEVGRSTGRLRDIYPISIPIATYLRKAAGYRFLIATHLDASKENLPIKVITHYTNKDSGQETPYFPYQDHLDRLNAHSIELSGWNTDVVKVARSHAELPRDARAYLAFLSKSIAPVIMATYGPDLEDYIQWNI